MEVLEEPDAELEGHPLADQRRQVLLQDAEESRRERPRDHQRAEQGELMEVFPRNRLVHHPLDQHRRQEVQQGARDQQRQDGRGKAGVRPQVPRDPADRRGGDIDLPGIDLRRVS